MKKCIECLHYEVCKFKDQTICRGTTVADTLHECKDFKSNEKRKLNQLEKQLDALLSDDKRTELEIDSIAALLG